MTVSANVTSNTPPLLIGLAAGIVLVLTVGVIPSTQRVFERLKPRRRGSTKPERENMGEEREHRPPADRDEQAEPLEAPADVSASIVAPGADGQSSADATPSPRMATEHDGSVDREREDAPRESEGEEAARITDEARRQARELIQNAELEAKGIVEIAGQDRARRENDIEQERLANEERRTRLESREIVREAERKAEELLAAAEAQSRSLVYEAEEKGKRAFQEIVEDAWHRARERLEEAEQEAKEIVVDTGKERSRLLNELAQERALVEETRTRLESLTVIEEAARKAEELLEAAEKRREELTRESEADAERSAAQITGDARRRARELVEEAELEAARIVGAAERERTQLVDELLARQRSVFEETRAKLSGFLADALEEVDSGPGASEGAANGGDLDEALSATAPAGGDR